MLFVPFNYFDEDVSKALRQGVRIDRAPKAKSLIVDSEREDIRRSSRHNTRDSDPQKHERKGKKDDGVAWFGGHYTKAVLVGEEMLSPDLSHYMKERNGELGGWSNGENAADGGIFGWFAGKERREDE